MKTLLHISVRFKIIFPILFFLVCTAFMQDQYKTVYYFKLMRLKNASAPVRIELINADNISRGKSLVSKGILFTYKDRNASNVKIGGNFTSWKLKSMNRSKDGVWFYFLSAQEHSGEVDYKFNVAGLWTEDPHNSVKKDDLNGAYVSSVNAGKAEKGIHLTFRRIDRNTVEFRLYNPKARLISLVGDFNQWNPENDLLEMDSRGVWRVTKKLLPGTYRYKFIVDGNWTVDVYNPGSATDNTGGICSVINIDR